MDAYKSRSETGDQSELLALERRLSIVTDTNRTEEEREALSDDDLLQAQTFDKLVKLANQAIPLKPVQWSVPTAPQKPVRKAYKKVLWTLTGAVAILFCTVTSLMFYQSGINPSKSTIQSSSAADGVTAYSYWDDNFEDQMSEFEGEMVCLNTDYNYSEALAYSTVYDDDMGDDF